MQRKSCEITDPTIIEDILSRADIGRMATIDSEGYPYITPVNFVYFQNKFYFHCALKGEKLDNIDRDNKVCFQVDIPLSYLDAGFANDGSPCKLHQFYHCVIIRGTARLVTDDQLKTSALNALVAKHEKEKTLEKVHADMPAYKACAVVEITPMTLSAKSDLAQGKKTEIQTALATYLTNRGESIDLATVQEMKRIVGEKSK